MIRATTNRLLRLLPPDFGRRLGFKLLRETSSDMRAVTDLFVPPYVTWADWRSGLGNGAYVLYALVRALAPGVIVETGSARGLSTCALALGCRHNGAGKVFAIDPHHLNAWTDVGTEDGTLPFLKKRLASYALDAWCEIVRKDSRAAAAGWSRPIDLLFIDGDHTFDGVRHDFEAFRPWLSENSLVLFHDTAWEHHRDHHGYRDDMGVPRYMQELKQAGYSSITIPAIPGLTLLSPNRAGFPFLPDVVAAVASARLDAVSHA